MKNILSALTQKRIVTALLLGFASGLPLALTSSTLQAWYTTSGVSLVGIGFIGVAALPYTYKFVWAPLMDRFIPPFLGRRRGWTFICQVLLIITLCAMAGLNPADDPLLLFGLACAVAFFSASQDIAADAYRTDVLKPDERALGGAMYVNGYRIAMLVSGGLALVVADHWGWSVAYTLMAMLMGVGILASIFGPEPENQPPPPKNIKESVVFPFKDFFSRQHALWVLLFIVCYKLGDAFAGSMTQAFLIRAIQFTLTEIGTLIKVAGFFGTMIGLIWGGLWMPKLGWYKALFIFGVLQALSNLIYVALLWTGANLWVAGFAIFVENLCGGMGTAAFVGLLMNLCNPRFTAFQMALLSSLSVVGRVFIGPLAGMIAEYYGWFSFFMSSLIIALPGLLLLILFKDSLTKMSETLNLNTVNLQSAPSQ